MIVRYITALLVIGVASGCPSFVEAKQKVATAVVAGKTVDLFDDNTWAYEDATTTQGASCQTLANGLSFCGTSPSWQFTQPPPGIIAQYKHDDLNYGEFIYENFGSAQGLTLDTLKFTAISNAANAANVPVNQIVVLKEVQQMAQNRMGDTLVYSLVLKGIHVVFANTLFVLPDKEVQVVTYSIGDTYGSDQQALHNDFLSLTHID